MDVSSLSRPIFFSLATIVVGLLVCKLGLLSWLANAIRSTGVYKKWFAQSLTHWMKLMKDGTTILDLMKPMFEKIEEKVTDVGGDVLEIGAGTGRALTYLRLPEESSLVVVDYNPFMEKHFRESLAKAPHIKVKDYLVQSATDMSNIPDNTFAVVYTVDVMCSLEIEDLKKMLKEIKRVLKPGGCLFFFEHVLDDPGTWRRSFQKLITSDLGIWPFLTCNCHCDREPVQYVQEAGFPSVTTSGKLRLHFKDTVNKDPNVKPREPKSLYPFNCFIRGCAQK